MVRMINMDLTEDEAFYILKLRRLSRNVNEYESSVSFAELEREFGNYEWFDYISDHYPEYYKRESE